MDTAFEKALHQYAQTKPHRKRPTPMQYRARYGWLLRFAPNQAARILDIGCGAGEIIEFFLQNGYQNVWGVDASESEVALARQRIGDRAHLLDANSFLTENDEPFDLVIMNAVIEHFPLEAAHRVLNSISLHLSAEGRLVIRTINCANPLSLYRRYVDITHVIGFTPESITQLLLLSGLEVEGVYAGNAFKKSLSASLSRSLHGCYEFGLRLLMRSWGIQRFPETLNPDMIAVARQPGKC
jgi:2-polyprenyl-3-methyl-5-hydroxy-6-metoxy-1,4-benzoquinol methylase